MKKTKKQLASKLVKLKKVKKGEGVFLSDTWKKQKEEIKERVDNKIKKVQDRKAKRLKTEEPVKSSSKKKKALANKKKQEAKSIKRKKFLEKSNKLK